MSIQNPVFQREQSGRVSILASTITPASSIQQTYPPDTNIKEGHYLRRISRRLPKRGAFASGRCRSSSRVDSDHQNRASSMVVARPFRSIISELSSCEPKCRAAMAATSRPNTSATALLSGMVVTIRMAPAIGDPRLRNLFSTGKEQCLCWHEPLRKTSSFRSKRPRHAACGARHRVASHDLAVCRRGRVWPVLL